MKIQAIATRTFAYFEQRHRADGTAYWCRKDNAPDEVAELCHLVHDGAFPNDWHYEHLARCLEYFTDTDGDPSDVASDFADSFVDCYTGRLLTWLSEVPGALEACDEAAEEFGQPEDATMAGRIRQGQWYALLMLATHVAQWLEEQAEEE